MNKRDLFIRFSLLALIWQFSVTSLSAQNWPPYSAEAKPGVRWWWLGSAVDKDNLQWSLQEYAKAGIGAVEITPIYGVQGNDEREVSYLSPKWMELFRFTQEEAARRGIEVDMATGTGWPFGGPWVPLEEAACKAVFADTIVDIQEKLMDIDYRIPEKEKGIAKMKMIKAFPVADKKKKRVIVLYVSRTLQKVKRAAPGGEGYVVDHFDSTAVAHYLAISTARSRLRARPIPIPSSTTVTRCTAPTGLPLCWTSSRNSMVMNWRSISLTSSTVTLPW